MSICVCLPDVRYSVVIMGIMGIFDLVVELFALGAALYPFDHSNEVHAITGITLQTSCLFNTSTCHTFGGGRVGESGYHRVIGRTEYQNVSDALCDRLCRTALILTEHFLIYPCVLALFSASSAKHAMTDAVTVDAPRGHHPH